MKIAINGFAAVLAFIVVIILAVAKFTEGAWVVVVLFPLLVAVLIRMHHIYSDEQEELEENVQKAAEAPVSRRHVVLVFVERFDLAAARALQYARSLGSDEPRAVHFVLDTAEARELEELWVRIGLSRVSLDLVECPDRRLGRAAMEFVAQLTSDSETEVTVLLPRRIFESPLRRLLHDRTAERIAGLIAELPNASATIIPFPLGRRRSARGRYRWPARRAGPEDRRERGGRTSVALPQVAGRTAGDDPDQRSSAGASAPGSPAGCTRSASSPARSAPSLECTLVDATGQLLVVFQGRRLVPGVEPGTRLLVEGPVGERGRRLAMTNPVYTILPSSGEGGADEGADRAVRSG